MTKYIYAFGSIVRGEIDNMSDVDLLLIKPKRESSDEILEAKFSIYTEDILSQIWKDGNPFSWHLYTESVLIHTSNGLDYIKEMGEPNKYIDWKNDCRKFYDIYVEAKNSLIMSDLSKVFDAGTIYLAIRNFSTCLSLGRLDKYNFSRRSMLKLGFDNISVSLSVIKILENCKMLSSRGIGTEPSFKEMLELQKELPLIDTWFNFLISKYNINE